ncbi:DUF1015 family protein [Myxococcota bacterium]|nr:DUF1015 family protein [Myxococcota bacterium]MBU1382854.1 DUF1015 family protein [Myxococcota bacterium]MBU1496774.1 DUF1015 family protein [Myxococcota bacterium]
MATVKPFRGLRPQTQYVKQVAALPYDVMDSAEARKMAEGNPYSFLRVSKPEITLDESVDVYAESVYQAGADNLRKLVTDGVFQREDSPAFYVYQQVWGDHTQTGLVAGTSADEYNKDLIKKHELTRADKEEDRVKHVKFLNCNSGLVFLAYKSRADVDSLIMDTTKEKPLYDFASDDGILHRLWVITDSARIETISNAFKTIECLYVADGHHRSASGARIAGVRKALNPCHTGQEEYNFFMSCIFPHNQLKILDYNRVVKDLNGHSSEQFMTAVNEKFDVTQTDDPKPSSRHNFRMFLDGKWYSLTAKPGIFPENDPVKSLDVSILQDNVLAPLLGIENPRTDKRIDFVGGMRGLKELERRVANGMKIAFALYPTSMEELMSIADSGKIMPPKSTWFEPKLRSGIVIRSLD